MKSYKCYLLLFSLLCMHNNCNFVQSVRYEGSTDPDFARNSYVQLEKNLWEKYVDKTSALSTNERLYKIFNQHYMFIKQFVSESYNGDDFSIMSRFFEWVNLEPDVKSIHGLFKDNFMYRLELDLQTNDFRTSGFDERANLDLAETVLKDPLWPVNATLEKIQTNIYNQGLYYKAIAVRYKLHINCCYYYYYCFDLF